MELNKTTDLLELNILLASPRGFCAGVDRAIQIVQRAIEIYGAPVYVRHEIVHNKHVVDALKNKGAVFVEELGEIPQDGKQVIFSAHGVAKSVPIAAQKRKLNYIDATCPLVSKVHRQVTKAHENGKTIILIGHKGHPEVVGTMGQLPKGSVLLVQNLEDVADLEEMNDEKLAYCTQTTLSVDDTCDIVDALKKRFPKIQSPRNDDICYATTNRQDAVKKIAPLCDVIFVIGSSNSSNSNRLVEVAKQYGCKNASLISSVDDINWDDVRDIKTLGLSAGASAPEVLMNEIISSAREHFAVTVREIVSATEDVHFKLPRELN